MSWKDLRVQKSCEGFGKCCSSRGKSQPVQGRALLWALQDSERAGSDLSHGSVWRLFSPNINSSQQCHGTESTHVPSTMSRIQFKKITGPQSWPLLKQKVANRDLVYPDTLQLADTCFKAVIMNSLRGTGHRAHAMQVWEQKLRTLCPPWKLGGHGGSLVIQALGPGEPRGEGLGSGKNHAKLIKFKEIENN